MLQQYPSACVKKKNFQIYTDNMAKSNLYTRTGDTGITSLVGGKRVKKNSLRLEAYGTLDEFSSFLGCVLSDPKCPEDIREQMLGVQNMLFNLGGYLASEVKDGDMPAVWGLTEDDIARVEEWVDRLDGIVPEIRAFVLPGGSPLASKAHVARSVCRRAERRILDLADVEYVDPALTRYINRLSDYLFIVARYFNFIEGVDEIVWKK